MKKSYYNLETEYAGYHLIFNTKTRSCVILDEAEYAVYRSDALLPEAERLRSLGIYADDSLNELQTVHDTIQSNILRDREQLRSHTIYVTTNCNAHCYYCFERGVVPENMSEETALGIAKYILQHQNDAKKLFVIWFGGEPMLNSRAIDIIAREIKQNISNNVEFRSSMYTNGFFLTEERIAHAIAEWNLKAVQITLDGMKATYENIRRFNVTNAFERVVDNIRNLLNASLRVQLRLNYDKATLSETLELIEYLSSEFGGYQDLYVYAYQVFSDQNSDNSKKASEDSDILILKKLIECGFCTDILATIKGNMNVCLAGGEYSRLYLPNGNIIKCDRAMDSVVGDINDSIDSEELAKWYDNRLPAKCHACKLLPVCGGGCIYEFLHGKSGCMNSETAIKKKLQHYMMNIV